MTNKLLNGLKQEHNWTTTENNAPTNISTLNDVLDFYYHAPAMRGGDVTKLFANAFADNELLAIKAAFYLRDIRGGKGERESFKQILRWLYKNQRNVFEKIVSLVPEYGTWKDILEFVTAGSVEDLVHGQLLKDRDSATPSLLAKWMPSENTSSKDTQELAHKWAQVLGLTSRQYRKLLTSIRNKLALVETAMSSREFGSIDYEHVPSVANLRYRKAFSKNDAERYVAYLESVKKGEKKINAATLYPYELVQGYAAVHMDDYSNVAKVYKEDAAIEALWNALPNFAESDKNALGVVDVSESMYRSPNGNKIMPIYVSVSLGIYLAERNKGAFHNNFMTFSRKPQLVTLRNGSLKSKVDQVFSGEKGYDTNIQAVFNQLLQVAMINNVPQAEMPAHIFIFSDMEFNDPHVGSRNTNYNLIKRKFNDAGYDMPTLVFWNIDSKQTQTPVTQDEHGVYLVSGCSPSVMKNALNTKAATPMDLMLETLNSERYQAVEDALI